MSRFRPSIAGLLGLIAAFGFGLAALRRDNAYWYLGTVLLTLGALLSAILGVVFRRERRRGFWAGFALFGWTFKEGHQDYADCYLDGLRVCGMVADLFQLPPETVGPGTSPDTVETWDSLQHLNLVLALEQEFQLQFTPEEIEQLLSVELIAALVIEKTQLSEGA